MTQRHSARLTDSESAEVILDGQTVRYNLKRSPVARHARLEVTAESGLSVIIPRSYPASCATEIIQDKKRWVKKKLELFNRSRQIYSSREDSVQYLGRTYKVITRTADEAAHEPALTEDALVLFTGVSADGKQAIENWLKDQARVIIPALAAKHSLNIGVDYQSVRIRSARTRWGSCSPQGTLSFNWKLIMAPPAVIEYVVIHELCHLKELNHSAAFWTIVEKHAPDWRTQRKWLRCNEIALTL